MSKIPRKIRLILMFEMIIVVATIAAMLIPVSSTDYGMRDKAVLYLAGIGLAFAVFGILITIREMNKQHATNLQVNAPKRSSDDPWSDPEHGM